MTKAKRSRRASGSEKGSGSVQAVGSAGRSAPAFEVTCETSDLSSHIPVWSISKLWDTYLRYHTPPKSAAFRHCLELIRRRVAIMLYRREAFQTKAITFACAASMEQAVASRTVSLAHSGVRHRRSIQGGYKREA